jgi:hypothetical protein
MARKFDIGGLSYDLLDIDDFDFDQGKVLKDLTGGMGLFDAQEGFNRGDMDVWRGLLLMSIQVKNPTFTMADLGRQKILGVILSIQRQMQAEAALLEEGAAAGPPAVAPARSRRKIAGSPSSSDGAETPDAPGLRA